MTYWVLYTIHHLSISFVQQLGGEVLHFSLDLWTAMYTSFFCFVLHESEIFLLGINTTSFIHRQQLTLFCSCYE